MFQKKLCESFFPTPIISIVQFGSNNLKMKKIVVLGSAGMLGHMVYSYLEDTGKYILRDASFPIKFQDASKLLDVTDKTEVEQYLLLEKPDIAVNCVGILIRGSISDPSNAIYINSYFPHQLSKLLLQWGGRLIHVSTDCVFSGEKGSYSETDYKDARDTYGLSKILGEVVNDHDLTLRTSIIGPELKPDGEGLFQWFSKQKGKVNGYTKAYWSGVTTLELSKAIDAAIEQDISGLYHISNGEKISKNDLLQLIKKIWNRSEIEIEPSEGKTVDKSLITSRNDFKFKVNSYENMLNDLCEFMKSNTPMYKQCYE